MVAAAKVQTEPDYLDVDIVEEDSGALPIGFCGRSAVEHEPELPLEFDDSTATFTVDDLHEIDEPSEAEPSAASVDSEEMTDSFAAASNGDTDYDYEYVDDSSGVEHNHALAQGEYFFPAMRHVEDRNVVNPVPLPQIVNNLRLRRCV